MGPDLGCREVWDKQATAGPVVALALAQASSLGDLSLWGHEVFPVKIVNWAGPAKDGSPDWAPSSQSSPSGETSLKCGLAKGDIQPGYEQRSPCR